MLIIEVKKMDPINRLDRRICTKCNLQNDLKKAINSHVSIKLEYMHKSNEIRLKRDVIKEELELSKAPTEKQVQAYIEEKLLFLKSELEISKENVNMIQRDLDLIDDEIRLCEYEIQNME